MGNHPHRTRARLARYGAKLRTIDGATTVEMVDPNDNARRRFQYRRSGNGLERRVLRSDGMPMMDGSPWEAFAPHELAALYAARGQYHPILDPLGYRPQPKSNAAKARKRRAKKAQRESSISWRATCDE